MKLSTKYIILIIVIIVGTLIAINKTQAAILTTHPNANNAYSLRKLNASYSGSAIRVRRDFDDTESDIGFSGAGLDTSTLLSFVPSGIPTLSGNWKFLNPVVAGTLEEGTTNRSELSGLAAMLKSGNEGYLVGGHDSNTGRVFILNSYGQKAGDIILTGATMTDIEDVSIYDDNGTPKVIVGAFGDNAASRTTKQLFRFTEPTVTGSDITIPNDGSWEQIDFVYPATPLWEGDINRGDVESMIVDSVGDNKIYLISKRETVNKIFSLPLQSSYSGTQTMTYEGEMNATVAEETGGIISPANAVGAGLSQDGLHVLVKTYNKIYQFTRASTSTSIADLLINTTPEEVPYVGRGSHPTKEPQGESVAFSYNDNGYYTISETGTGSGVFDFPLFFQRKTPTLTIASTTAQDGLNSYAGTVDTYVNQGANEGVSYGSDTSMVSDKNPTDERFSLVRWEGIEDLVPDGATVVSATLGFTVTNEGQGFDVHKIIGKDWDESTTWTSLGGMNLDDVDASAKKVARWSGYDNYTGSITVDLDPAVVQDWIDTPAHNKGLWLIGTDVSDGQQLATAEATTQSTRPKLIITYYMTGGGYISKWYDQSGNGYDLTQTTSANQPKIVDAGSLITRNSLPAIYFDGNDYLQKIIMPSGLTSPAQQFVIGNFDDLSDTSQALYDISQDLNTDTWANFTLESSGLNASLDQISVSGMSSIIQAGFVSTSTTLFSQLTSNTHNAYINNTLIDEETISSNEGPASQVRIGQRFNSSTYGLIGTLQEIIFYNSDLSDDRFAIQSNMSDYWISSTPPSQPDLDATDTASGHVSTSTSVNADTETSLSTDVLTPTDPDIDTIKIVLSGLADGADELLILNGSTEEALNADFSATSQTVGGISGVDYTYTVSDNTLLITKHSNAVFTGAQIEAILETIKYKNTETSNTNDGNRVFTVSYIDSIDNESVTTARATINVSRTTPTTNTSSQNTSGIAPLVAVSGFSSSLNTNLPTQNPKPCLSFTQNFSVGQSGEEVMSIQTFLKNQGFFTYPAITTYYGPATESAVKKFQLTYHNEILDPLGYTTPTGNWYPATRAKANALSNCNQAQVTASEIPTLQLITPPNTNCPIFTANLKPGDEGADVLAVQKWLGEYTYLKAKPNGYFGPATTQAVKDFQQAYKASILSPVGLSNPTGMWFSSTRTKANALGCKK